jgi:flagellin-like protein
MILKMIVHLKKRLSERRGVSPVLATIIIFAIIISGIMIAVVQVFPEIERMRARSTIESVESGFLELDAAIMELVGEGSYGTGAGTSVASRTVSIHTPQGSIGFERGALFNLQLLDESDSPIVLLNTTNPAGPTTTSIFLNEPLGALDYQIDSTHKFLSAGKMRYLTGASPDTRRDHVMVSGVLSGSETSDLSPTNLTLSRDQEGGLQHIQLNYRVRVVVSYQTGANPTLRFDIVVIKLVGAFEQFYQRVKTFQVRVTPILKATMYNGTAVTSPELNLWFGTSPGGQVAEEIWSSRAIPALPVSSLHIEIRPVIFEVQIS